MYINNSVAILCITSFVSALSSLVADICLLLTYTSVRSFRSGRDRIHALIFSFLYVFVAYYLQCPSGGELHRWLPIY
jgi:hypothetical protein